MRFALTSSAHPYIPGGQAAGILDPVILPNGKTGRLDLVLSRLLSRSVPQADPRQREYLVIELKRPSQPVNAKVLTRIENYAMAVAADPRFQDTLRDRFEKRPAGELSDVAILRSASLLR